MGLFSRKFDSMQTEEQKYAAGSRATQRTNAAPRPRPAAAQAEAQQPQAKRGRIKKVGTLRRIGPNQWETRGWEIDLPDGSGRGRVVENGVRHEGTLAGFTPAELCAIAHGRNCRNCR